MTSDGERSHAVYSPWQLREHVAVRILDIKQHCVSNTQPVTPITLQRHAATRQDVASLSLQRDQCDLDRLGHMVHEYAKFIAN